MKKIIALILVVVSVFGVMSISAYAEDASENTVIVTVNEVDFIFDANTSEEYRNKVIAHYFNHSDEDASAYGLTCTLFGHKIESSVVVAITHKVRATDPKCLQKTYNAETCSRCDYTNSTLLDSTYISCC
mgnify:CR=1 FL=1